MRTVSYRLDDLKKAVIHIGRVAENEYTRVQIDAGDVYAEYPSAAVSLTVQPPAGEAYPATVTRDGGMVIWDVKDSALTDEGTGEIQLTFTSGDVVVKSCIGRIHIDRSIIGTGEIPSALEDFLAEAGAAVTAIPETINSALAEAKASGEFDGPAGADGTDGADGFSPVVSVSSISGGHSVSITDAGGTETFNVMDGQDGSDGQPGADGHTPVLTSSKSGKVTTIYSDGTQLAQISDGEDGQGGNVIDDTAGAGDTDKTWSADKLTSDVLSAITQSEVPCYVSSNGSDSNDGTQSHPFATFQHAINAGYKKIIASDGTYSNQQIIMNGLNGISIICNSDGTEYNIFESHKRRKRARIDNSIDIGELSAYNSIYRASISVANTSSYYKVFISQELDPVYSGAEYYGRITTYNAILWEVTGDILTCTRLVPKLTLVECEATHGTFFFDGDYIYINPTSGSITGKSYKRMNLDTNQYGVDIRNCANIHIQGIDVAFFPYYDAYFAHNENISLKDCCFTFTSYGNAVQFAGNDATVVSCISAQAGADGFGVSAYGDCSFYNCSAIRCYDDGISHHDGSTGVIDGGLWTNCLKGGITPSYGSNVNVKNAVCKNNVYGIYYPQSGNRITNAVLYMQNCLSIDNTTKDIKVTGYNVESHGCVYGTKEIDSGSTFVEYGNTVIATVPCTGITLDESTKSLTSMSAFTLTATPTPENTTDSVVWTSSDQTIASVVNGVVTPLKLGEVTITASCGSYSASCDVTINNVVPDYVTVCGYNPYKRSSNGNATTVDKKTAVSSSQFIIAANKATGLYPVESKTDVDTSPYRFVPILIPNGATKIIINSTETSLGKLKSRTLFFDSTKQETTYGTGGAFCVYGETTAYDQGSTANPPIEVPIPDNIAGLDSCAIALIFQNNGTTGNDYTSGITIAFAYGE